MVIRSHLSTSRSLRTNGHYRSLTTKIMENDSCLAAAAALALGCARASAAAHAHTHAAQASVIRGFLLFHPPDPIWQGGGQKLMLALACLQAQAYPRHAKRRQTLKTAPPQIITTAPPLDFSVAMRTEMQKMSEATITYHEPLATDLHETDSLQRQSVPFTCVAVQAGGGDEWCATVCLGVDEPVNKDVVKLWRRGLHRWRTTNPECSPQYCTCHQSSYTQQDMVKIVQSDEKKQPSGLPECMWQSPEGCSVGAPYECMEGASAGQCSAENWYGKPSSECTSSCMHAKLLERVQNEAWYAGPLASTDAAEEVPHYEHDPSKLTMEKRGINVAKLDVRMSNTCKQTGIAFVGVSFYSPSYVEKAKRLIDSCERNQVCCKAVEMPKEMASASGEENVIEGTNEYRWQLIAMKPAFILNQLEANQLPVVFLDTDLEFHKFPGLFMPGSWPDGPRDLAIFNFWGNQSSEASPASLGSGLVFVNKTVRAKRLVTAWAEGMAFEANKQSPDDQVLNKLINSPGGNWMPRASFGWLPAGYLRHPPLLYYGVDPVIDHDHGNPPGLIAHSSSEPVLPPEISGDPALGGGPLKMKCEAVSPAATAEWCVGSCTPERCPEALCDCKVDEGAKDAAREAWMAAKLAATRGSFSLEEVQRQARDKQITQITHMTKVAMPPSRMPAKVVTTPAEKAPAVEVGPAKVHLVREVDGTIHGL